MASTVAAPRINAGLIQQYVGQRVTIIGKVAQSSAHGAELVLADKAMCHVTSTAGGPFTPDMVYELVCVVNERGQLLEESRTMLNADFDFDSLNELIKLSHQLQFADMFVR
jgi:hypothetical protein